jgi:hypothetical protein
MIKLMEPISGIKRALTPKDVGHVVAVQRLAGRLQVFDSCEWMKWMED